jgi:predicted TPR repeat methyltransferase
MAWEFERALASYLAALEAQPKDLHALVRAAQIHERRGEPGPALEFWERVLAVRPDHAEAAARVRELRRTR